jgi:hypothetical protein
MRRDSRVLFRGRRYSGAVYLMGYCLEFSLKRKIAQTLAFTYGFPETPIEFNTYASQISHFNTISTGLRLGNIKQIKHHKLYELIVFSGAQSRIFASYLNQWNIVQQWRPEDRYKIKRYTREKAKQFMKAAIDILMQIT